MSEAIVTDLKQWAYCPRIVYYRHVMPGVGRPTFKMEEAKSAQELIERLELRRGLREYGTESARRHVGVWLSNPTLGLAGKVDLVLEAERSAAVVDFKLTSGESQVRITGCSWRGMRCWSRRRSDCQWT